MKPTRVIACLVAAASFSLPGGQSAAQTTVAPQEFPPPSFAGRQYVDSAGCAFIRAGQADAVQWVPRVTRNRRLVCGLAPSLARAAPTQQSAPADVLVLTPALQPTVVRPGVANRAPGAPVPRATGQAPAGTVVTPDTAAARGVSQTARVLPRHLHDAQRNATAVTVPQGYRSVWQDDRLNPRRAEQTLGGRAQMREIWSQTTPRRLRD